MMRLVLIIGLALALQGCIFVVGAAAGAAAVAVVYDHRSIEKTLQDTQLANAVAEKIKSVPHLKNDCHIEITAFNNIILLTGQTPNPAWREQAQLLAQSAAGNARVYNQLSLQGPTSALTRTSDAWLTTKIKTQMLTVENLKSSSIKVVTENGVVYLMGRVNREQADTTVDIARQASGAQKVVKIFQYQ